MSRTSVLVAVLCSLISFSCFSQQISLLAQSKTEIIIDNLDGDFEVAHVRCVHECANIPSYEVSNATVIISNLLPG